MSNRAQSGPASARNIQQSVDMCAMTALCFLASQHPPTKSCTKHVLRSTATPRGLFFYSTPSSVSTDNPNIAGNSRDSSMTQTAILFCQIHVGAHEACREHPRQRFFHVWRCLSCGRQHLWPDFLFQCLVKENEWIRRVVCNCEQLDPSIDDSGVSFNNVVQAEINPPAPLSPTY